MQLRVVDFFNLDQMIEVPTETTAAQLKILIKERFSYDTSRSYVCRKGVQIDDSQNLPPIEDPADCIFALFNYAIFPQKSYPKVDHAFVFLNSHLQDHYLKTHSIDDTFVKPSLGGTASIYDENYLEQVVFRAARRHVIEEIDLTRIGEEEDFHEADPNQFLRQERIQFNTRSRARLTTPLGGGNYGVRIVRSGGRATGISLGTIVNGGARTINQVGSPREIMGLMFGNIAGIPPELRNPMFSPLLSNEAFEAQLQIQNARQPTQAQAPVPNPTPEQQRQIEHEQAIRRLMDATGIDRMTVAQVYSACDQNEENSIACLMSLQ